MDVQQTVPCKVLCRAIAAEDLREVLRIERASSPYPWSAGDFFQHKPNASRVVMIARHDGCITGFLVYSKKSPAVIQLENLAVAPEFRRLGVGHMIISGLQACLRPGGPLMIATELRESNLVGQLFLREAGFKASGLIKDFFSNRDSLLGETVRESAIAFQYLYNAECPITVRIAE